MTPHEEGQGRLFTPDDGAVRMLTVRQPWAWAIVHAGKNVENRRWSTDYRGRLLIHAGREVDPRGIAVLESAGVTVPAEALAGRVIVGAVQLADCIRNSGSPWARPGVWHWLLESPEPATAAVSCRGQEKLFAPPAGWEVAFS